jgi:hypothetical protein
MLLLSTWVGLCAFMMTRGGSSANERDDDGGWEEFVAIWPNGGGRNRVSCVRPIIVQGEFPE